MHRVSINDELPDPQLSELIDVQGPAWNQAWNLAFPKLLIVAGAKVRTIIRGADDDLVNEMFKRGLKEMREGLEVKRLSPDPEVSAPWMELEDFSDLENMFAKIVGQRTIDYTRKHNRECPYKDQLRYVADEESAMRDVEWYWAFHRALKRVQPKYRVFLIGMFVEERDTHELMAIHNLTKGAVAGRTRLGKEEFRAIVLADAELKLILWPQPVK